MNHGLLAALEAAGQHRLLAREAKEFALRLAIDNPDVEGMDELKLTASRFSTDAADFEAQLKHVLGEDYRIALEEHEKEKARLRPGHLDSKNLLKGALKEAGESP